MTPPIRIAKKREAESPTIPCTPPHDGEIKIRAEDPEPVLLHCKSPADVPAPFSGVKTFLPVVDFQNQKRFRDRRKVNPMPIRHPSYSTSAGGEPAEPSASFSSGCAAMNKIKEVVKQKLFSPSMLMSSSSNGNGIGCSGGSNSYQEKMKMNRSNLVTNRRSVLSNAEEDDSTESDNPMDEGR